MIQTVTVTRSQYTEWDRNFGNQNVSIITYFLEAATCQSHYRLFEFWNHTLWLFNYVTKQIIFCKCIVKHITVTLDSLLVITFHLLSLSFV